MGVIYEDADPAVYRLLNDLIDEYRGDLSVREVTFRLMYAYGGLVHQGYPALGLCALNSVKLRAQGLTDVTIYLDGDHWGRLSTRRQRSLVHHELHHVEPGKGNDAAKRPKLRLRKHDHQLGIFTELIRIYGEDSVDRIMVDMVLQDLRQMGLPFGGAEATATVDEVKVTVDVLDAAFAALLTVGHTEPQARAAIDKVLESGKVFASVSDMIDFIYQEGGASSVEPKQQADSSVTLSINGQDVAKGEEAAAIEEVVGKAIGRKRTKAAAGA